MNSFRHYIFIISIIISCINCNRNDRNEYGKEEKGILSESRVQQMNAQPVVKHDDADPDPNKLDKTRTKSEKNFSWHDNWPNDSSRYEKYQYFDMFSLRGYGSVEKEPFVYVLEKPGVKIVRVSDDICHPFRIIKVDDYWVTFRDMYMELDRNDMPLSGPWPHKLAWFFRNDTIYEFKQMYSDTEIIKSEGVYTRDGILYLSGAWEKSETKFTKDMFHNLIDSIKKHKLQFENSTLKNKNGLLKYKFLNINGEWIKVSLNSRKKGRKTDAYKMYDYPIMFVSDKERSRGLRNDYEYVDYSVYDSLINPTEYVFDKS